MFIEYENNYEDYIKAYEKWHKSTMRLQAITNAVVVLAMLIFPIYHKYRMSTFYRIEAKHYIDIILIGVIAYVGLMFILNKKTKKSIVELTKTNIKLKPATIGKKSIELVDGKIIHKAKNDRTEYNLNGIDNVFEYNNQVLLCTNKLNPMFIIPSRYFENDKQKQEFIKIIASHINIKK